MRLKSNPNPEHLSNSSQVLQATLIKPFKTSRRGIVRLQPDAVAQLTLPEDASCPETPEGSKSRV